MDNQEHPIVVIGASAGGVQALLDLVAQLPPDFGASVLVVVHIGAGPSVLPALLGRRGALPAAHGADGTPIEPGHVYVAPPDYHMLVRDGRIELSHGPRENHSRPSVDLLFRSAARARGRAVTGVILSGALSDGAVGLEMVKARGGTAIVQDPDEALVGGMPSSALRLVQADHVLPAAAIGRLLAETGARFAPVQEVTAVDANEHAHEIIKQDFREQEQDRRNGQLTMFTCPDCGGTLWQTDAGLLMHFECHVGHAWEAEALLFQKSEMLEDALWSCVRLLEERATLSRQVARRLRDGTAARNRSIHIEEQAQQDEERADLIRSVLHGRLAIPAGIGAGDEDGGNA